MRYAEFEQHIKLMATLASPESCRRFALDSIRLMHESAESTAEQGLTIKERQLLSALVNGVETLPPEELNAVLAELIQSTNDPVRAEGFHPQLIELLCAIDHWIRYQHSGNPYLIARLAINSVNSVDYAIGGDTKE